MSEPIPAQNSIEIQLKLLNSGLSLALPKVTFPYFPNAMYNTNAKTINPSNRYHAPNESEIISLILVMTS